MSINSLITVWTVNYEGYPKRYPIGHNMKNIKNHKYAREIKHAITWNKRIQRNKWKTYLTLVYLCASNNKHTRFYTALFSLSLEYHIFPQIEKNLKSSYTRLLKSGECNWFLEVSHILLSYYKIGRIQCIALKGTSAFYFCCKNLLHPNNQ